MLSTVESQEEEMTMVRTEDRDPKKLQLETIPVVEGQKLRSGVPVIAGYIPAGHLIPDNFDIPTYDPRTGRGYQRPLQESRVNELVTDLRKIGSTYRRQSYSTYVIEKRGALSKTVASGCRFSAKARRPQFYFMLLTVSTVSRP